MFGVNGRPIRIELESLSASKECCSAQYDSGGDESKSRINEMRLRILALPRAFMPIASGRAHYARGENSAVANPD
jgi:hypothetical protein